jgi:hypothetical protein
MKLLLLVLLLTGCAAAPLTPCQRQCSRVYDTCMDVGGSIVNPQAMWAIQIQCEAGYDGCVNGCEPRN